MLLYGLFINLNNFGIDQSYVQRYHAAKSEREARRSLWLAAALYLPLSLLFLFIGTGLYALYEVHPELAVGIDRADAAFPHFITHRMPEGVSGLLLAALFAAGMSSIDTSLNSSVTVILSDLYRGYVEPRPSERRSMQVLYAAAILTGALGTVTALAMIGVTSLLEAWWTLSGIFAGGMLGLFLLGIASRRADRAAGILGVTLGVFVIFWMTVSPSLPQGSMFRSPFHSNMITVIGTMTIFLVGVLASRRSSIEDE